MRYHPPIYVLCVSSHFWPFTKVNFVFANFKKSWSSVRPPPLVSNLLFKLTNLMENYFLIFQLPGFFQLLLLFYVWINYSPAYSFELILLQFCPALWLGEHKLWPISIEDTSEPGTFCSMWWLQEKTVQEMHSFQRKRWAEAVQPETRRWGRTVRN